MSSYSGPPPGLSDIGPLTPADTRGQFDTLGKLLVPFAMVLKPLAGILVDLGLAIRSMFPPKLLTLNIEDDAIYVAEFRGRKVTKWGSQPLPSGMVNDGVVNDCQGVSGLLGDLLTQRRIRPRRPVCSISSSHSLSRIITLPPLPSAIVPEAIRRETGRLMPVVPEVTELTWKSLGKDRGVQRFFLLAIPRNAVESLLGTLKESGTLPRKIELKALALARSVHQQHAVVVDVQPRSIEVAIVIDGLLASFRVVSLAVEAREALGTVADEVHRTIDFYNSSHQEQPLDEKAPLLLTGTVALDEDSLKQIAGLLHQPLKPARMPVRHPRAFDPTQYAVNVGLALGAMPSSKTRRRAEANINLLPPAYRPQHRALKAAAAVVAFLLAVALIFPLYQMSVRAATENDRAQAQWYRFNQKLAVKKWMLRQVSEIESAVAEAQGQAASLSDEWQTLRSRGTGYDRVLTLVFEHLPPGMELNSVMRTGGHTGVDGVVYDADALVEYIYALEQSGQFSGVRIKNMAVSDKGDKRVTFALELIEPEAAP